MTPSYLGKGLLPAERFNLPRLSLPAPHLASSKGLHTDLLCHYRTFSQNDRLTGRAAKASSKARNSMFSVSLRRLRIYNAANWSGPDIDRTRGRRGT